MLSPDETVFYMMECIHDQQQPLCATLLEIRKLDLMPSDEEFTNMEQFLEVMRPLFEITEALGAQKWVTVSTIRPLLHQLFNKFLKSMPSESRLAKLRKQKMQHNLINQYTGSIVDLLNVATFLDPRFRTLKFLGEEKDEVVWKVTEEAPTLSSPLLFDTSAESTDGRSLELP